MKPSRLLIVGIVLGLVAVVLLNVYVGRIRSSQTALPFVALKPDVSLVAGQKLQARMLHTVALPEGFESLIPYAMPANSETYEWLRDRHVTKDVPAGSFLLHEHFLEDEPAERFAAAVEPGMRAVTIPVNPRTAVAYFIEPGSRVDVLATMEVEETVYDEVEVPREMYPEESRPQAATKLQRPRREKKVVTKTILQNVEILAVGRATTRGNYMEVQNKGFATVTVEATPADAEKIVFAIDEAAGELTLVLRNPEDAQKEDLASVSWEAIE